MCTTISIGRTQASRLGDPLNNQRCWATSICHASDGRQFTHHLLRVCIHDCSIHLIAPHILVADSSDEDHETRCRAFYAMCYFVCRFRRASCSGGIWHVSKPTSLFTPVGRVYVPQCMSLPIQCLSQGAGASCSKDVKNKQQQQQYIYLYLTK